MLHICYTILLLHTNFLVCVYGDMCVKVDLRLTSTSPGRARRETRSTPARQARPGTLKNGIPIKNSISMAKNRSFMNSNINIEISGRVNVTWTCPTSNQVDADASGTSWDT